MVVSKLIPMLKIYLIKLIFYKIKKVKMLLYYLENYDKQKKTSSINDKLCKYLHKDDINENRTTYNEENSYSVSSGEKFYEELGEYKKTYDMSTLS
ncbi:hypothetical protein POCGH01_00213800 [Plasmodium ovale]|uniref:Uncharacterized protein n=1 Tax=Plasmodium ovale TaxID=36330 RepID=A0A1D3JFD1_PLAOA|nr:hypothetical protein POCGH01_00213800 [Plasmodium ovale]